MVLTTTDICNYLQRTQPIATKFKKEVLEHLGKKTSKITLADLANFEGLNINDAKELVFNTKK